MKHIVLLCDGMADYPVAQLGGKTPMEAASKPNMDRLAAQGAMGLARTVPPGMVPGSDTANLSVMGYDPKLYYTGRSPLEAVNMGVDLGVNDIALRCNLVTLSDEPDLQDTTMVDYCAGDISTPEAAQLMESIRQELAGDGLEFFTGLSYRHCMVIRGGQTGTDCTPPHDITGRPVRGNLPRGRYEQRLTEIMQKSRAVLAGHPVNKARQARGLRPANACWLWGEGTRPRLPLFEEKYGLKGGVVSAVDLIKGIGICAGLRIAEVEGATANFDTNYGGKAQAALQLLAEGCDFVYVHVEAPDECGHRNELENKVRSIELIDSLMLGPILEEMGRRGQPFSLLVTPDHPTPLALGTHVPDPVPFILWRSDKASTPSGPIYTEAEAARTGLFVEEGHMLMRMLVDGSF